MCLIIFAHRAKPGYPLIIAANRDEFYARPAAEADTWGTPSGGLLQSQVLAGRDLQAGGTWLGITRNGRFAAVTNIYDPSQPEKKQRSRGDLTKNFLKSSQSAEQYCEAIITEFHQFAGFNLLIGDGEALYYANNFEEIIWRLEPGIYGLSNGLLNSGSPKVERGKKILHSLLNSVPTLNTDQLIRMMADQEQTSGESLPSTGATLRLERQLSSIFTLDQERLYGTRCSTALIRNAKGDTCFCEQNYDSAGSPTACHYYELSTKKAAKLDLRKDMAIL